MILRLLVTAHCDRTCKGCCNKDFNLPALPVCEEYSPFSMVILTGGEPMLYPQRLRDLIRDVRAATQAPIILYTAYAHNPFLLRDMLKLVDGMTLTLHTRKDVFAFLVFNELCKDVQGKSLRLNVFRGIPLPEGDYSKWLIKKDMQWIKDCPLPKDEIFMRAKQTGE